MIKDITIGQYFPFGSLIHRLDARTKLLLTMAYVVIIFIVGNFISLGFLTVSLLLYLAFTKVPAKIYLKALKPIVPFILITAILNIFYVEGTEVFQFYFLKITQEGLIRSAFVAIRILLLITASSALTYTTSPTELTDAIERLLKPLNRLHVDTHTFAMMMTIALRFIPTLIEETDKIMNAQKARGANIDTGSFLKRIKALIPILIPLLVSSFRRAKELADAMECRCYSG
ncbi:MAG: transporter, partial [Clostridiales bacterium 43-6]